MFDSFMDGDLMAEELAALHQSNRDEHTTEVLCSRVYERRVPRLPVAARIRQLERAERRGRGRGRASMLHARRPKMDDLKPGLQQTQETNRENMDQDYRLRPEEFPPLTSNTNDPPSRVPTTGNNSTCDSDTASATDSLPHQSATTVAARPKTRKTKQMDRLTFAAKHEDVLKDFPSLSDSSMLKPKRIMTLTKSNLDRHSKDMDVMKHLSRVHGYVETNAYNVDSNAYNHPEDVRKENMYEAYPVTLDDIEVFKHTKSQVPKKVKGRVAGLLNASRLEEDNIGNNVDNLGDVCANPSMSERDTKVSGQENPMPELGAQFKGQFSFGDYDSNDTFDSVMSNLSEGVDIEDPEEWERVDNFVPPVNEVTKTVENVMPLLEELPNSHSEFVNSANGDLARNSVEPPDNWEQHVDENHEAMSHNDEKEHLNTGRGEVEDNSERVMGETSHINRNDISKQSQCNNENSTVFRTIDQLDDISDKKLYGHSVDNRKLAKCIDELDDIHVGQSGKASSLSVSAKHGLEIVSQVESSIDNLDDINLLGKSPPLCQIGKGDLHEEQDEMDDIDEEFFVEVKSKKKKHIRRDCREKTHKAGVDNTIWRLYGPCVMQISGLPANCDISVLREMVCGFGTVQDEQTRQIDNGCSVRFKFAEEDSCMYAVETLHLTESLFPDANCVLNCEKLKF